MAWDSATVVAAYWEVQASIVEAYLVVELDVHPSDGPSQEEASKEVLGLEVASVLLGHPSCRPRVLGLLVREVDPSSD